MEAGFLRLEDGTGFLRLESGSGNLMLEADEFGRNMLVIGRESNTVEVQAENFSFHARHEGDTLEVAPENNTVIILAERK